MKEDLRKEKEIASFGGMGLPGRAGGYGGGSGPLRDDQGNIVTDLNKVGCLQGYGFELPAAIGEPEQVGRASTAGIS